MPYIEPRMREEIDAGRFPATVGELNYLISMCALKAVAPKVLIQDLSEIFRRYSTQGGPLNYQKINDILGALTGAALELQRRSKKDVRYMEHNGLRPRVYAMTRCIGIAADNFYRELAAPYEDTKIQANGDLPYEA